MTRVIVVDDAAHDRLALRGLLSADPQIEVVGEGANGFEAAELTRKLRPDVIVMDVLMPGADGYEATTRIMAEGPCPIVLVSSAYPSEAASAVRALAAGAVAILEKPGGPLADGFEHRARELLRIVKLMDGVNLVRRTTRQAPPQRAGAMLAPTSGRVTMVAMAASTGGPRALADVLTALPATFAVPILVVQHIGAGFEDGLVTWLRDETALDVQLARGRDRPEPGQVLVAPSGAHLGLADDGAVALRNAAPVDGHCPSATSLFQSVARTHGRAAVGVILTGMGRDGAAGLLDLRQAGGRVIAQDEATSVVYGMPREAVSAGAVDIVLPVEHIAPQLIRWTG